MHSESASPLTDSPAVTWIDAFPWLPAVAHADLGWWGEPIGHGTGAGDAAIVSAIAELASERLSHWSIGQILPGLRPDIELRLLDLPTRASNALTRHALTTTKDLAGEALASLMNWRGIGAGTINSILEILIAASTSASTPPVTTTRAVGATDTPRRHQGVVVAGANLDRVVRDLETVANWYSTIGAPEQPLLVATHPGGLPDDVSAALMRLQALRARDVASGDNAQRLGVALENALQTLEPRAIEVLRQRLFSYDPPTLEQLSRDFGVSRERVRQIEGKARGALLTMVAEGISLHAVSESIVGAIGTVRPLASVLEAFPSLSDEVPSAGQPAWRVLDQLDDAYEIVSGWCAVPTLSAAEATTQTQVLEAADRYGVARIEEIDVVTVIREAERVDTTKAWLAQCGYVLDGEFVLTRTRSVGDYGAAVLSIVGTPMSSQEIIDRFIIERSPGSLRNAMSQDERFERVDRDLWALKEWGMDAYSGIRSVIREQVARNGGQAKLEQVIEYITGRYSVSASSVVAYASAPPFEVKDGVIRPAREQRVARKSPQGTRRLFRRADGWVYRITVTADHLRGSGSVMPVALATLLHINAGESVQLPSRLGPQTVAWTGIQPSFGTIRRFLTDADVEGNTDAFLVIGDDRTFGFEPTRGLVGSPLEDALSLVGAQRAPADARAALARAVSLPEDTPYVSLIAMFRERGDDDIADLLIVAREQLDGEPTQPSPAVNTVGVSEILDLL